jgi:hypothetical protein
LYKIDFMNKINLLFCLQVSFIFSRVLLISDSIEHPLNDFTSYIESFENDISVIFCENCNIIDTLETLTENDIIFWEKDNIFTMDEKEFLTEFKNMGGSLILFGKSIYDDPTFFINLFGGTFLRNTVSEKLIVNNDTLYFNNGNNKIELQLISNYGEMFSQYDENSISSISNINNNGSIINGFWLEEIEEYDRQVYIDFIFDSINRENVVIELESIEAQSNDSLSFNLSMENFQSISELNLIINIENNYLSQFSIQPTLRSENMNWEIINLPFGNIKIVSELNSELIDVGNGPIAVIKAIPGEDALGKIALQFLEFTILDSDDNELPISANNGEILFNISLPQIYFSNNNSIILGESNIFEIILNNEIEIAGLQFCLQFESTEILFVRAEPTERIPIDWWVGQFGQGSNNEIQIASLGTSHILPGNGPILEIEVMSVGEIDTVTSINFCNSYLFNDVSDYLEFNITNTDVHIFSPEIIINPIIIQSENYTDILYPYESNIFFSGFQMDIELIESELSNVFGYYESYITNNFINETFYRILGFKENMNSNYPNTGTLCTVSFNSLNTFENNIVHKNFMFSNNQGELVYSLINPPVFNDLLIGDVDGNGILDIKDLLLIQSSIVLGLEFGLAQNEIADIDLNGLIDITDVLLILHNLSL